MNKFLDEHSVKILDSLPEGVYVIDKEFKIRFVNKAGYELTKKTPSDILGNVCTSLCKSERCELGCPITEVLNTGKNVIDLDSTIGDVDGNLIPVTINAALLINDDKNPIGGIISFKKNKKFNVEDYLKGNNQFYGIIGNSKPMRDIYNLIKEISTSFATVLITGETGVGKELIANAIYNTSQRSKAPFVKINCAVLPDNLLASELFGHVKGAFTDARQDRIGRFEYADGGTIFLDEIAELPIDMQAQLLRVIQDGTFERLGETITRRTDVRIIAATNKNLKEEIKNNKFREDLFYRLNVVPINIPPLSERSDDLILLIDFFIKRFSEKYNKNILRIDDESLQILSQYDWPGNIRELENCIEYAFIRSKRDDYICSCSLPPHLRSDKKCNEKLTIKEIEMDEKTSTLLALLRQNHWNKSKVAEIIGVNRSTIHRRLKKIEDK